MNLSGKTLIVTSITRQNIFDADYIGCCDNCGKTIVNIANVKDEQGNQYEIGLDCKKTLIDKPIIDQLMLDEFMGKYNVKEYKSKTNEVEKFLKFCAYTDTVVKFDHGDIIIWDKLPSKLFEGITGNIIYSQSVGYLMSLGLTDFINNLNKKINQYA
jgi:hypothetical protein